jgi:hypothetical protein
MLLAGRIADSDQRLPLLHDEGYAGIETESQSSGEMGKKVPRMEHLQIPTLLARKTRLNPQEQSPWRLP